MSGKKIAVTLPAKNGKSKAERMMTYSKMNDSLPLGRGQGPRASLLASGSQGMRSIPPGA
ncbi:hypothetical protein MTBLM1_20340 [Rhodospirillaceae bacterium LM-1]|nr:hypothetical protein MTBLM1_20340 [Rhodospirillaceae bacterium LM-1]